MKMQKRHGNPVEIIGDGIVAETLRDKYQKYNADPSSYKTDIFGTASKFAGQTKQDLEQKFKKAKNKLHL